MLRGVAAPELRAYAAFLGVLLALVGGNGVAGQIGAPGLDTWCTLEGFAEPGTSPTPHSDSQTCGGSAVPNTVWSTCEVSWLPAGCRGYQEGDR